MVYFSDYGYSVSGILKQERFPVKEFFKGFLKQGAAAVLRRHGGGRKNQEGALLRSRVDMAGYGSSSAPFG